MKSENEWRRIDWWEIVALLAAGAVVGFMLGVMLPTL